MSWLKNSTNVLLYNTQHITYERYTINMNMHKHSFICIAFFVYNYKLYLLMLAHNQHSYDTLFTISSHVWADSKASINPIERAAHGRHRVISSVMVTSIHNARQCWRYPFDSPQAHGYHAKLPPKGIFPTRALRPKQSVCAFFFFFLSVWVMAGTFSRVCWWER